MFLSPQDGWIKKFRTWEKRVKNSIIRRAPALEEWFFLGGVSPSLYAMSTSIASRKQLGSISDLLRQRYINFEHIIISANKKSISFFDHKKTYRYFWLKVSLYPYFCTSFVIVDIVKEWHQNTNSHHLFFTISIITQHGICIIAIMFFLHNFVRKTQILFSQDIVCVLYTKNNKEIVLIII